MKTILFIFGTRPEAIKLAPLILELKKTSEYKILVCNTEQQKELSNQTLSFFGISANINLDVMSPNQTLAGVQGRIMSALGDVFAQEKIDATIVQGDTMSVFCGALMSFYNRVPVFHVEAGLRSYDLAEPFPEEAMRQMTGRIVDLHFAPTSASKDALLRENINPDSIFVTGNTVIDALHCLDEAILDDSLSSLQEIGVDLTRPIVLLTVHRRENHGARLGNILRAVATLTQRYPDHQFVLPVHPNPNVQSLVHETLGQYPNVVLTDPMDYPQLVSLMRCAKLVLTDSGGIQEEAPSFGVPVLVMRYETERKEGIEAGCAKLVGADEERIVSEAEAILSLPYHETRSNPEANPYGDGKSSQMIATLIERFLAK